MSPVLSSLSPETQAQNSTSYSDQRPLADLIEKLSRLKLSPTSNGNRFQVLGLIGDSEDFETSVKTYQELSQKALDTAHLNRLFFTLYQKIQSSLRLVSDATNERKILEIELSKIKRLEDIICLAQKIIFQIREVPDIRSQNAFKTLLKLLKEVSLLGVRFSYEDQSYQFSIHDWWGRSSLSPMLQCAFQDRWLQKEDGVIDFTVTPLWNTPDSDQRHEPALVADFIRKLSPGNSQRTIDDEVFEVDPLRLGTSDEDVLLTCLSHYFLVGDRDHQIDLLIQTAMAAENALTLWWLSLYLDDRTCYEATLNKTLAIDSELKGEVRKNIIRLIKFSFRDIPTISAIYIQHKIPTWFLEWIKSTGKAISSLMFKEKVEVDLRELSKSKISQLDVSGCQVEGWSSLKDFYDLENLILKGTPVPTLHALELPDSVKEIDLSNQPHSYQSMKGLRGFTNVKVLHLENSKLKTMRPLKNLPQLERLFVARCPIRNWGGLDLLTTLQVLDLSHTDFQDVHLLSNLYQLTVLKLSNCKHLKNTQALKAHTEMQRLELDHTNLEDLAFLGAMQKLEGLYLKGCKKLTNTKSFSEIKNLREVDLTSSNFHNLNDLRTHENLALLKMSFCSYLTNMQVLGVFKNLSELHAQNTNFQDLNVMKEAPLLQVLNLKGCFPLRNLRAIDKMPALRHLKIPERYLKANILNLLRNRQSLTISS